MSPHAQKAMSAARTRIDAVRMKMTEHVGLRETAVPHAKRRLRRYYGAICRAVETTLMLATRADASLPRTATVNAF